MVSEQSLKAVAERRPRSVVEFDRIHQMRAHEYVAEQIRRHIALRLVAPGEALPPEREMARMFGVGRPTIQHALRVLEAQRLVEARRGRFGGTFVLTPSADSEVRDEHLVRLMRQSRTLDELLEYRLLVEPLTARVAAESHSSGDIESMESVLRILGKPLPEAEYMRFDTEFHIAIAEATHNRYLKDAIIKIRAELNDALIFLPETDVWHSRLSQEHNEIFGGISESLPDAAESASRFHVTNSNRSILAVVAAVRRRLASESL
jgi:GntR family transcriptional regulator, transcriptional repressor for pyruvate dehydrogenase complex